MAKNKDQKHRIAVEELGERRYLESINHATELRRMRYELAHQQRLDRLDLQLRLKAAEQACTQQKALSAMLCFVSFMAGVALGLFIMLWRI